MRHHHHQDDGEIEDHDKGLAFDLPRLISRRRALGVLSGTLGTAVLTACGASSSSSTKSFGDSSGVAEGVPTTVEMTLLDVAGGGSPMAGAAVYLWHCTPIRSVLAL